MNIFNSCYIIIYFCLIYVCFILIWVVCDSRLVWVWLYVSCVWFRGVSVYRVYDSEGWACIVCMIPWGECVSCVWLYKLYEDRSSANCSVLDHFHGDTITNNDRFFCTKQRRIGKNNVIIYIVGFFFFYYYSTSIWNKTSSHNIQSKLE